MHKAQSTPRIRYPSDKAIYHMNMLLTSFSIILITQIVDVYSVVRVKWYDTSIKVISYARTQDMFFFCIADDMVLS